jgi:hypothetical protein
MFSLSTHRPVSHETDADFPINLNTQPRVCQTNFIEENARFQDASKLARLPLGEHAALRNQRTQRLPLLRNQDLRNRATGQRRSLSQSRIAVGSKFAYSRIWNGREGTGERLSAINVQIKY